MKKVILQQPRFLPWAGHWHKVLSADFHIMYCGVKFDRTDYIHRVKVGEGEWLTIPLEKDADHKLIKDIKLGQEYKHQFNKMAKTIRGLYMNKKAKYGEKLAPIVIDLEEWNNDSFLETSYWFNSTLSKVLGLNVPTVIDHDSRCDCDKVSRVDACLAYWMDKEPFIYLMGSGGSNYMELDSLNSPSATIVQEKVKDCYFGSILKQIAFEEDPLAEARECFRWIDSNGGVCL